ncbi:phosphonate metabolism protein/1,5-bisphosphokinase (PRPP-forming) PhnN [Pelagibius marinus]|uniref:phosphonate metabolism protein/1,5-bisphosphokinase (PRPP-forming) PhnN n=1 Tax=Pelagibius marinus TaxID=2762760 RepID=UPI001872F311|nr:phosphonate metabolism protein/1,5-bisphosphokinase (PRPP-forming) PhnN [Pelagibius marinus]
MPQAGRKTGHLFLVVGPSGAGKDSLIEGARQALAGLPQFVFPRRVITRQSDPASEDHFTLSEAEFDVQLAAGAFFLHWGAHELRYALPGSIADALAGGSTVIANVSRRVIDDARRRHPATTVVFVTAPQEILTQRLLARGREDAAAVKRRLARSAALPAGANVVTIVNDGPLERAVERFLAVLKAPAET